MTNTNIYTRLNNLVCALRADEDNCDLVGTVRDTVDSCRNYVGMVDRMEANIRTARETMSLMWTRTTARATTRSPRRLLRQLS